MTDRVATPRDLPSGTVTFLFTDIEGSTRLLHELDGEYAEALAEHRRLLRHAFVSHGGVEVDTQGDAFFVAFVRATEALAAAADAQQALDRGPIKVRMGLHTGEPLVTDEGYVGLDVHRAARIAAAGHGGQVLLSQTVRDLVDAAGLRDLGEHRLKDLGAPVRLFQVGEADFPPLKTLYRTNLPVPATRFLGREKELEAVVGLIGSERLVTLTGRSVFPELFQEVAALSRDEDAARLLGASDELRKEADFGRWDQADYDETSERVRAGLGSERYEALRQEGASMTAEEALGLASACLD